MNIDIKTADGADIELGGTYYDEKGTRYRVCEGDGCGLLEREGKR